MNAEVFFNDELVAELRKQIQDKDKQIYELENRRADKFGDWSCPYCGAEIDEISWNDIENIDGSDFYEEAKRGVEYDCYHCKKTLKWYIVLEKE